ncbi:hypothetical protein ACH0AK_07225 [Enterococcus pernyi]
MKERVWLAWVFLPLIMVAILFFLCRSDGIIINGVIGVLVGASFVGLDYNARKMGREENKNYKYRIMLFLLILGGFLMVVSNYLGNDAVIMLFTTFFLVKEIYEYWIGKE